MKGQRVDFARVARFVPALTLALAGTSCVFGTEGRPPDPEQIYFPTGVAVSAGRTALYVANSDFDLKYAGGTIQLFDAAALRQAVGPLVSALAESTPAKEACTRAGLSTNDDPYLNPGPCEAFPVGPFLRRTVFVGAFASRLSLSYNPDGAGARLWSPVRGDPSLTYIDVDDDRAASGATPEFRFDCNADSEGFCGNDHRVGRNTDGSLRGLRLPPDPVGTAISMNGDAVVSAHPTQTATSLVVNAWDGTPYLSYFATNYANGPSDLTSLPRPRIVDVASSSVTSFGYRETFVLAYRGASQLDLVEYFPDGGSIPPRPFLVRAQQVALSISSANVDSRGIAVSDSERRACEAACGTDGGSVECLASCAENVPLKLYVANRTPATLLVGRVHTELVRKTTSDGGKGPITAAYHRVVMHGAIPLETGPSNVRIGQVVSESGQLTERIFAVAFDSRAVFVVDPHLDAVEAIVRTGRGPQDIAIDSGTVDGKAYSFAYVVHFTDSYLGIVPLDLRLSSTYGQVVASLGAPLPPAEAR